LYRLAGFIRQELLGRPLPWFLLGAGLFLYLNLFVPPFTPMCLGEDEGIWLLDAMRMWKGQVIYRDFFQFTAPGTQWIYFVLFKMFTPRLWIPNALLILIGVSLVWLSVVISKKVVNGWLVYLPGLAFLPFAFRRAFALSHQWWSALSVTCAMAVAIENRTYRRLAMAGALCGLASWFTQTQGLTAAFGLGVFLLWDSRRKGEAWSQLLKKEALVFASLIGIIAATNAYFIWKAGLKQFVNDTVVFVMRYYPAFTENSTWKLYLTDMPRMAHWYGLPKLVEYAFVRALLPAVYVVFLLCYRRQARMRPREHWDRLMLLNIMGLFLFLSVGPSASWFRFCTVSIPGLILLVWLLSLPRKLCRALAWSLSVSAVIVAITEAWWWQNHWRAYLDAPGGRAAMVMPNLYEIYRWVLDRTQPWEFFFEAVDSDMYFTLSLQNPAAVDYVSATNLTRPEQVEAVIKALKRHRVRFVLWSSSLDSGPAYRSSADHLGPLRAYLRNRYRVVKTFPTFEQVWERQEKKAEGMGAKTKALRPT